jgi:hypothetical protein
MARALPPVDVKDLAGHEVGRFEVGWRSYVRQQGTADGKPRSMLSPFPRRAVRCDFAFAALARSLE